MASTNEDQLLEEFSRIAGQSLMNAAQLGAVTSNPSSDLGAQNISTFDPSSQTSTDQESHRSSRSSTASSSGGGGIGTTLESVASTIFGGTIGGIVPIIAGLFGGGSSSPPPLQKYAMPSSISFEAAETGNGLTNLDYGQMGTPRMYGAGSNADAAPSSGGAAAPSSSTASGTSGTPQVNINVQAMDSRSFMDYSGEIAKAVRDAMLNMSSINDVVNEL